MNHPAPTAADFFAQPEDDDDTEEVAASVQALVQRYDDPPATWAVDRGMLYQIPADPMERIATALEAIAGGKKEGRSGRPVITNNPEPSMSAREAWDRNQTLTEELADLADKYQVAFTVIEQVEEALGKSTAKPSLAAKAVIDAWKNPQVTGTEGLDHALETYPPGGLESVPAPLVAANEDGVEGHTRSQTEQGPDYCRECSEAVSDWVVWPCPPVAESLAEDAPDAIFVPETAVTQPAHDAPVEAWRSYAVAQGLAGPEIAKANRSQIRTALGIAQPVQPVQPVDPS